MIGILVLLAFELSGVLQARCICKRRPPLIRMWLGLVIGLMEMMWLPSLYAFAFGFTMKAQLFALATSGILGAALLAVFGIHTTDSFKTKKAQPPLKTMLILLIPIAAISVYLHYTHTIRDVNGALHVGQSTYGDLCMHLSFATGLIGQSYPPEYTLLPGNILGYPFLVDAFSSTMLIFGTPLNLSFSIPGALMTVLVYGGFFLFSWEITRSRAASVLSLLFLFLNGGFGFLYTLDLGGETGFSAMKSALFDYYKAPANMPDLNLRWVNALCDLLIPQRTLMAGWLCVIPALYLLYTAMKSRRTGDFIALGLFSGPMVMIHTHSFLALGLISLGAFIDTLIRDKKYRNKNAVNFMIYGTIAALLALPQLMVWTFPQTIKGGSLRFLFNWVNNQGDGTLRDGYLWFWIKNVGPMFILIPIAAITARSRRIKALALGALILYAVSETVIFQPNVYDNNKLFYVAYIAILPTGCAFVCEIYRRLKGIRLRPVFAALFIMVCTLSGAISIARECISDYEAFSPSQTAAAEYIRENTFRDSLFLTSNNHNNAVASLTGRRIVCGSGSYLYYHGLDYGREEANAVLMLAFPEELQDMYAEYGIDYVFVSNYEKDLKQLWNNYVPDASLIQDYYSVDEDTIAAMYPAVCEATQKTVYDWGVYEETVRIYAVSERARVKFQEEQDGILKYIEIIV